MFLVVGVIICLGGLCRWWANGVYNQDLTGLSKPDLQNQIKKMEWLIRFAPEGHKQKLQKAKEQWASFDDLDWYKVKEKDDAESYRVHQEEFSGCCKHQKAVEEALERKRRENLDYELASIENFFRKSYSREDYRSVLEKIRNFVNNHRHDSDARQLLARAEELLKETGEKLEEKWFSEIQSAYQKLQEYAGIAPMLDRIREYQDNIQREGFTPRPKAEEWVQQLERVKETKRYTITFQKGEVTEAIGKKFDWGSGTLEIILRADVTGTKYKLPQSLIKVDNNKPEWGWTISVDWKAFDPLHIQWYDDDNLSEDYMPECDLKWQGLDLMELTKLYNDHATLHLDVRR
jgi:ElaB/YqjD/DUF883 family membrane-anchored ribosome-binding protein